MQDIQLVIDIGTNSVRLLAARVDGSGIATLSKRLITTRLGQGMGADGTLSAASMERTVAGVTAMLGWGLAQHPGAPVHVFGTSALRDASNRAVFSDRLRADTGLWVHIVSGAEEARLAFAGAVDTDAKSGVIDIGGGSTELMIGESGRVRYMQSVPIGVVRLGDRFSLAGVLPDGEQAALADAVREELSAFTLMPDEAAEAAWVGVGGTVTVLAAMEAKLSEYSPEAIQKLHLDAETVRRWFERLSSMALEEKKKLPGLPPERADIIAGGACILGQFMDRMGVDRLRVSDRDNLEGYLILHVLK